MNNTNRPTIDNHIAIDEREARAQREMLTRTGRLDSWEKRVGRKGVFLTGSFNADDEFTPNPNSPSGSMLRREGLPLPTGFFIRDEAAQGRFRPCTKCGRAPSAHNPHPLNDGYVGHEYA